ncbi:hypothetical protein [Dyadobacter bucti]|uniref:hypothetical protein n=1 Tax=Dyadobacter bucti TaxID=2572203 RepID=UPI0035B5B159
MVTGNIICEVNRIPEIPIFATDLMRPVIVYIWLFTTILPTFSQWGTIAYYQINKAYITRVLCENRNRPQLNCNGQCYLAKKLKEQQEKQDQQTGELVQNIPVLQLFASPLTIFEFMQSHFSQAHQHAFLYHLATYQAPLSILVPPPCV